MESGRRIRALIYLDTHTVVELYDRGMAALGAAGRELIDQESDVRCSPMVRLEMQYLAEIRRVEHGPAPVFEELGAKFGLRVCDEPFFAVVREAERQTWTRDPFDRIIVAQAELAAAPLVTRDAVIHGHYTRAVW